MRLVASLSRKAYVPYVRTCHDFRGGTPVGYRSLCVQERVRVHSRGVPASTCFRSLLASMNPHNSLFLNALVKVKTLGKDL